MIEFSKPPKPSGGWVLCVQLVYVESKSVCPATLTTMQSKHADPFGTGACSMPRNSWAQFDSMQSVDWLSTPPPASGPSLEQYCSVHWSAPLMRSDETPAHGGWASMAGGVPPSCAVAIENGVLRLVETV